MTRRRTGRQRSDCAAAARGVRLAGLLITFLCAALAASLGAAAAAAAEPGEVVWRDFAQRAGGGVDVYTALAVGPTGTVCAAGSTASAPEAATDVLVRTYGSGGGVQWRRVWTWPGRGDDEARAVARDRRGAYVVAGASGANWLLLKYSRSGYLQWVRRARGRYARCSLIAVIVDGDGNVYATGRATPGEGPESMLTLKYSSSGKLRWLKTFASEAGDSAAAGITLGGGAVYVAGTSQDGTGGSTAVLLKYATAGAQRWARACAGPGAEAARATALAYTTGPLLCGWSALPDGDEGFVALFSPAGEQTWSAGYEAPGVTGDRFEALAVDGGGRACVTGTAVTAGGDQAFTACFDPAGLPLWTLPGAGTRGLAVCRSGDGFASSSGTAVLGAARATASGAPVWVRTLTPSGFGDFQPVALRGAGDTYLYAAGSAAADGGGRAALLVRYRP